MQVGLARGEPLGERERVAGLDQHVQPPALDLRALADLRLCDLGHLAHGSVVGSSSLRRTLHVFVGRKTFGIRDQVRGAALERACGFHAAQELLEPRLDHRPFGLGVGAELLEPPRISASSSSIRSSSAPSRSSRRRSSASVASASRRSSRCAPASPDVREPLGEHRLRLAREHLDCAVELARQAPRRVLAARLDERRELLRRVVGVRRRRALDDALELLDLLALARPRSPRWMRCAASTSSRSIRSSSSRSRRRIRSSSSCSARRRSAACDSTSACAEASASFERLVELGAQALQRGAQLLALGCESLAVGGDAAPRRRRRAASGAG